MIYVNLIFATLISFAMAMGDNHQNIRVVSHDNFVVEMQQKGDDSELIVHQDGDEWILNVSHMQDGDVESHRLASGEDIVIEKHSSNWQLTIGDTEIDLVEPDLHRKFGLTDIHRDSSKKITINGLDSLDDVQKQAIRDAIIKQGVSKEVVFNPDYREQMMWTMEDGDEDGTQDRKIIEIKSGNHAQVIFVEQDDSGDLH